VSSQASRIATVVLSSAAVLVLAAAALSRGCGRGVQSDYQTHRAPFVSGGVEGQIVVSTAGQARLASWVRPEPDGCDGPGTALAAVAWIEGPKSGAAPKPDARLKVGDCGIEPAVAVAMADSMLSVSTPSADHRIQAWLDGVRMFDAAQGGSAAIQLVSPGIWQVRCAAGHPGEEAWVVAIPNAYGELVDGEGRFAISRIPVGRWTLATWHPLLGTRKTQIDVTAKAVTRVDVLY
jgi:hypothetical protein